MSNEKTFLETLEAMQETVNQLRANHNTMCEYTSRLQSENEELRKLVPEWVSVFDRMPEVGEKVLICFESENILMGMLYLNGWMAFYKDSFCAVDEVNNPVMYWQPIPLPVTITSAKNYLGGE